MHEIIDVASDVRDFAEQLAARGVQTVIRYYNHRNSTRLPTKALTTRELKALEAAGLSVAVVFQQRGGAEGHIGDFTSASGARDAARALEMAASLEQPQGSGIYFGVDWDYYRPAELQQIRSYFSAINSALAGRFACGVYGSGGVGKMLKQAGLVEHIWISAAQRWSGTPEALRDGEWTLHQKYLERRSEVGGFIYDGNILNPRYGSFGQFRTGQAVETPRGVGTAALYEVVARSGLNLRSGPGTGDGCRVIQSLPSGTVVAGLGSHGAWIKVDLDGDRQADGYMFSEYLRPVTGGLPLSLPSRREPVDVAKAELDLNIREFPGTHHNPRIMLYHGSTSGGAAPDETPWCSSFVNYCVEQAGVNGTGSKWARSWHDSGWGQHVTSTPQEGDIVVWRRHGHGIEGGHVGFFISDEGGSIRVLGGNQSDKVCIARYPKNGTIGSLSYDLLSIRRA